MNEKRLLTFVLLVSLMLASGSPIVQGSSTALPLDEINFSRHQPPFALRDVTLDDWVARGDQADAFFGQSVSIAGDVNGDGYDDVIVGAPLYDDDQTGGRVFVWYGGYDGLGDDGTPSNADWQAQIDQADAWFGLSVGTAGDVDGDGYDDIIVGAPYYDNTGASNGGRVFVWYGSANGLGSNVWQAEGELAGSNLGWSVGTAGDVNGDGYDDVIAGAPRYQHGEFWEGGAFVWYGASNGLGADSNLVGADWKTESNQEQAGQDSPEFGNSVGTAGDVNGDGYDDVIVGSPHYEDDIGVARGRAFVWHGSEIGLGATGTPTNTAWWAESDLSGGTFGFSVSTAGNVNGDGYDEVIVGAWLNYDGESGEGAAFVYHGSASGLSTTANWMAEGGHEDDYLGFSVGTAGDTDGDGYDDVIVGAPGYAGIGRVSFWYGSGSGLGTTGPDYIYFNPSLYGSRYGESVSAAEDVNGDGGHDFIIGAPQADGPQSNAGHAYVHYGEPVPNWAFLLYLDGDDDFIYSDIEDAVVNLEHALPIPNPNLTVLALLDSKENGDTWRYHVQPDGNYSDGINRWDMGELDMGDPQTLIDFVTWARDNYHAKHYYLAVADHGRGTSGIAWDKTSGSTFITVTELRTALQSVTWDGSDPLDVMHYDACLMGMLENAYQVQDYADYLIVSENEGWSLFGYDLYVAQVTATTTPEQLATAVADEYHNALGGYPRTISALDLEQAGAAEDAATALATALQVDLDANKYYVSNSRDAAQKFDSRNYCVISNDDQYLDLYDFARLINQNHPAVNVKNAAQGVMDAVNDLVVAEHHESGYVARCRDEHGVWHYGVYWDLDDAHGVSIFFPPASGGDDYNNYMSHIFDFTVAGQWDEFLQDYFGLMGLPPDTEVTPGPPPMIAPDEAIDGLATTNDGPTPLGSVTTLTATITAGDNVSYTWDFDDGHTGSGAVVTHTYSSIGIYTAIVTASNSTNVLTATTTVTVTDESIVGLVATNDSPTVLGNATTLTATIAAGGNVSYTWDFDDGDTGSGAVVTHTYASIGFYTAIVTASNRTNVLTATTTVTVTVADEAIAGLVATNDSPTPLGSPTTLTAAITTGSNVSYVWAFNDGSAWVPATGAVVTHTYPAIGVYTAVVTASNRTNVLTATTTVTIESPGDGFDVYLPLVLRTD